MLIAGFQKTTLIDYPGRISSIIFTQGCMFRCKFCHNAELVPLKTQNKLISEDYILEYLKTRIGKLDGLVISGGEPAIQRDLSEFCRKVKDLGFLVKLDTTGYFPEVVEKLLAEKLVDYIAMDVKAPLEKYENVVQVKVRAERLKESINLLMNSDIEYEFRTTVAKCLTSKKDLYQIAESIKGAKKYYLQKFSPVKTLDPALRNSEIYTNSEFEEFKKQAQEFVEEVYIR